MYWLNNYHKKNIDSGSLDASWSSVPTKFLQLP